MRVWSRVAASLILLLLGACGGDPSAHVVAPPPDLDARFQTALDLIGEAEYDRALEVVSPLLVGTERHPKRDAILFVAAECRYHRGDFVEAEALYRALAEAHGESRYARAVPARRLAIGIELLQRPPATLLDAIANDRRPAIEALGRAAVDDPSSELADDAFLELATAHLEEGQPDLAVAALRRLIEDHPDSPRIEEAWYRIVLAWRANTRGAGYDPQPLSEVRAAAVRYLERYGPTGQYAVEVAKVLRDATLELAAHETRIAEFYARRGNATGEAIHRGNAQRLLGDSADGPNSVDLLRAGTDPSDLAPKKPESAGVEPPR